MNMLGLSTRIGVNDVVRGCPRATKCLKRRMTISRTEPSEPQTDALCKVLELFLAVFTVKQVR